MLSNRRRTCKTRKSSLQKGSRYGTSVSRSHIVDTDTIADAIFADAISETSSERNPELGPESLSQGCANHEEHSYQKNPRAHKNKIGTSPRAPQKPKIPPP